MMTIIYDNTTPGVIQSQLPGSFSVTEDPVRVVAVWAGAAFPIPLNEVITGAVPTAMSGALVTCNANISLTRPLIRACGAVVTLDAGTPGVIISTPGLYSIDVSQAPAGSQVVVSASPLLGYGRNVVIPINSDAVSCPPPCVLPSPLGVIGA